MNICLTHHQLTSKINIELKYHLNRFAFTDIDLHLTKIHEKKNAVLVSLEGQLVLTLNQLYRIIEFERADIKLNPKS